MNFTSHLFASASRFWMALTASHDSSTNVSAGHVSHPPQYQPPPAAPANAATSSSPVLVNPSAGPSPSQRVYRVNGSDAVPVDSLGEDLFMGESITNFTIEKQLSPMGTTPRTCIGSSNFFQNGLRRIRYISREWNSTGGWGSEAWVYRRLFDIRGLYVSPVLGLYRHSDGRMNLCLDAPHPDFWIEASPEMPTVLKLRCATALQALHDRGVIHGGVDLCNYLIGADGRVTIINFQNSAVIHERPEGCPLPLIDAKYARLEMLKLQFKLDLLDIRPTIISLHALDALNQHFNIAERRKAKFVSGYVPKFRAISDTYIPDDQWQTRWINPTPPPRRFIMPDCTTSHLSASIQEFINLNERESVFYQMSLKEAKARLGFLPSRIPLTNGIRERLGLPVRYPLTSTSVDNTPPTSHAISLPISKKRKATTEAVGTPAPKRVRVENRRTSVTTTPAPQPSHPSRRTFPSRIPRNNKLHFRLSRDRRYRRTGEICAEEGIPHPWALIIRPDHPAWRKPEIALYIHMQQTELFSRNGHGKSCRGRSISVGTIKRGVAYCRSIYPILHFQTGHRSNSYNPDPREVPVPLVKDNRWEPRDTMEIEMMECSDRRSGKQSISVLGRFSPLRLSAFGPSATIFVSCVEVTSLDIQLLVVERNSIRTTRRSSIKVIWPTWLPKRTRRRTVFLVPLFLNTLLGV
ncbi:hypothetical protein DL96DRAFT_1245178 [Flagelloscypha sp. PMI_526]|nr:hypothetical protein DL96DRAFT_1245178 [Flagelloscypha sp. PMI_526]